MKNLIKFVILLIVFVGFIDHLKKKQSRIGNDVFVSDTKESPIKEEQKVTVKKEKIVTNIDKVSKPTIKNGQIIIKPLGNIDDGDLEYASKVINDFYEWEVIFDSKKEIKPSMLNNNGDLLTTRTFEELIRESDDRIIYITDKLLYDHNGTKLRGAAFSDNIVVVRGDKSFMKETIIHEVGHLLGLNHCNDLTCVMAINNDDYDSGDFCNKCKLKINKK